MFDTIIEKLYKSPQKTEFILKSVEKELSMLEDNLIKSLSSGNTDLDKIVTYVFNSGGKRLRPALLLLFVKAVDNGYLCPNHFKLAEAVEMIHTASLLHDDVIDDAETRRGFLTVSKKWDSKTAIIAGDYILSKALTKLVSTGALAVEMFAETLNELCIGEITQKNQSYKIITLDEYINKSERKTAKLFMAGVESAACITLNTNNLIIKAARDYSLNFGIAFQIMDDILNFKGPCKKIGKPTGNDMKNGIITAPIIFAIQEYEEKGDKTLTKLFKSQLKKEKDFEKAKKLIFDSNGIKKAELLADKYVKKSIDSLDIIENNCYKQALINLANYAVKRNV